MVTEDTSWLITGGCGFIGTALIKHLLEHGLAGRIRVLDNLSVGSRKDLERVCQFTEARPKKIGTGPAFSVSTPERPAGALSDKSVELVPGDIRDTDTTIACCQDIDIVVHLAANTGVPKSVENPRLDMECNVMGTFNMLEAARHHGIKRFVFASSGAPAGEVTPPIHEELPPHPVSPYGASKLAGEGYCSAYFRTFGIETVALRFSNVYGPGSSHKTSVVAKFIKRALAGQPLEIYGDGTQTRDFIYIDDLIDALILAATKNGIGGETFQIATSRETTLDELTTILLDVLERSGVRRPQVKKTEPRLGDVKRNFSDTTKARRMLGWKCRWDLEKGLEKTVDWFLRKEGYN